MVSAKVITPVLELMVMKAAEGVTEMAYVGVKSQVGVVTKESRIGGVLVSLM